jgi:hypothetical protein
MGKATIIVVGLLLPVCGALAADEHHAAVPTPATAKPAKAESLPASQPEARVLKAQIDRILKTRDPAERQRLMREHMQTLRQAVGGGTAPGMMDHGMDGQMMERGMAMHQAERDSLDRIERRLEAMQRTLDQMAKPQSPASQP